MNKIFCIENRSAPFIEVFRKSALEVGYTVELGSPEQGNRQFSHFHKIYQHFSINSPSFELACFQRYFSVLEKVKPMERFVICDSDLIIQCGVKSFPEEIRDFTKGLVGSIGVTNGIMENDISPHFSIWTTELLIDFCNYLIHTYETQLDNLKLVYEKRRSTNPRASISDMTLLNMWVNQNSIHFLNSNKVFDNHYLDHNISHHECVDTCFTSFIGRKKIFRENGKIKLSTKNNASITAILLHLQGRYKIVSEPLYHNKTLSVLSKSIYIASGRKIRSIIEK